MHLRLIIGKAILKKCNDRHQVSEAEIREALSRYNGIELEDTREWNKSTPGTKWFLGRTGNGRLLKLVYIPYEDDGVAILRTCYEPNPIEIRIFRNFGGVI